MSKKLEFWVAWRYLIAGSSGFSKLVNGVSLVGLMLGITVLIVVSSVHNGLRIELQDRLLSVVPHAFVPKAELSVDLLERLRSDPEVDTVQLEFRGVALIGDETRSSNLEVVGVEQFSIGSESGATPSPSPNELAQGIALPSLLAQDLKVELGDPVVLTLFGTTHDSVTTEVAQFTLNKTFYTGTEFDSSLAIVSLEALEFKGLIDFGNVGWNVSVFEPMHVEDTLAYVPGATTWVDVHGEKFRAFQFERISMYIVLTLVLMLASFNIIAAQSMLINIKRGDIAILTTLGLGQRQLSRIFLIQGGFIAVSGIALGVILGIVISSFVAEIFDVIDDIFDVAILEQSNFQYLPAKVDVLDVSVGVMLALLLSTYALIKPLRVALKESPVFVLNRAH